MLWEVVAVTKQAEMGVGQLVVVVVEVTKQVELVKYRDVFREFRIKLGLFNVALL